ncbi:hypothetical protein MMC17_005457 [Xylographa soralifera]|nr:hypothetical protein [Xylographa soralifera]
MPPIPLARGPLRRFFSATRRYLSDPHPYERHSTHLAHELPGAAYYMRRVGRTGALFIPFSIAFFGWPLVAKRWVV